MGPGVDAFGTPLWTATARLQPVPDGTALPARVDVAVIGGGFTGLTAALHLAERGRSVAVFEAGHVGAGSSGVNAGFVVPNFAKSDPQRTMALLGEARGRRLLDLVARGAERVFETAARYAIACDAEQTGWLHLAATAEALPMLTERAAAWRALGRPVRMLGEAEARALTAARRCAGALIDESGGTLHPLDYARGLAAAALKAGASIHQRAPVNAVRRHGSSWRLDVGDTEVDTDRVLLCTNASSTGIARRLMRTVVPLTVYQIATAPLPVEVARRVAPRRQPLADTRANLFTARLDRDNRLISGGMAVVPVHAERRMARAIAARLADEFALETVPEVAFSWRGTAAMTPDFVPRLYNFGDGFVGGIGCNGRGVAMTAMLGEVLADAADGVPLEDLPVPTAPTRGLPFHPLARLAPSVAVAHARLADRRTLA